VFASAVKISSYSRVNSITRSAEFNIMHIAVDLS